mmetsp:Transcript_71101/g.141283  ORF Transcript_71101/g.141283 Transcript_71101/m.141283 type:complete len:201 (-) Transcript_71101:546-1148(-)
MVQRNETVFFLPTDYGGLMEHCAILNLQSTHQTRGFSEKDARHINAGTSLQTELMRWLLRLGHGQVICKKPRRCCSANNKQLTFEGKAACLPYTKATDLLEVIAAYSPKRASATKQYNQRRVQAKTPWEHCGVRRKANWVPRYCEPLLESRAHGAHGDCGFTIVPVDDWRGKIQTKTWQCPGWGNRCGGSRCWASLKRTG